MNILLSHAYSTHNNGDAAIVSAQITELRRTFNNPELHILTIDAIKPGTTFDDVPVSNALMFGAVTPLHANRFRKLLFAFCMMSYTTLWAAVFRGTRVRLPLPVYWREPMRLLLEADMQVCVGGGYLRAKKDSTSTVLLLLLFHQIWLAKLLKKPVYLYAQSFGPYPTRSQTAIATFGLKQADLILVREAKSKQLLDTLGLTSAIQVPDSAFMFAPPINTRATKNLLGKHKSSDIVVGITVRAWLDPRSQAAYEQAMAAFIDHLQLQGFNVAIIAQVTSTSQHDDDRVVGKRIKRILTHHQRVVVLNRRFSHYEIKSVFANLDYLVGTRFHSVIFALTAGVPALAIEYEHKTSGIMQDLGLEKWVLPIEAVTADILVGRFAELVKSRQAYLQQLNTVLPEYISSAHETGRLIRQAYEQTSNDESGSANPAPDMSV